MPKLKIEIWHEIAGGKMLIQTPQICKILSIRFEQNIPPNLVLSTNLIQFYDHT
jgi:hypothetical protein